MKHRNLQDLMSDENLTPEDVAQFILFETDLNDNDKFRVICDLIVCCEKVRIAELEKQNTVYREALEKQNDECPMGIVMCGLIDCNCKIESFTEKQNAIYKQALIEIKSLRFCSSIHPSEQGKVAVKIAEQALNPKDN